MPFYTKKVHSSTNAFVPLLTPLLRLQPLPCSACPSVVALSDIIFSSSLLSSASGRGRLPLPPPPPSWLWGGVAAPISHILPNVCLWKLDAKNKEEVHFFNNQLLSFSHSCSKICSCYFSDDISFDFWCFHLAVLSLIWLDAGWFTVCWFKRYMTWCWLVYSRLI